MPDLPHDLPSPVPADAYLRAGELPFTAFGQFGPGMMDNRVFDQDQYWVDIHGTGRRLEQMTNDHRAAVITLLLTDAVFFHQATLSRHALAFLDARYAGDEDATAFYLEQLQQIVSHGADSYTWLEATPLMRRLRQLTPGGPTVGDLIVDELTRAH